MQITQHFTLEELTKTNSKIVNIPNNEQFTRLKDLTINVLEPLRQLYGRPITVNSGFRNQKVNKEVKGVPQSQHTAGQAADITSENNVLLFYLIIKYLEFDQLIWEKGTSTQPSWVHVSFKRENNRMQIINLK